VSVKIPIDYMPKSPSFSNSQVVRRSIMKFGYTTGSCVAACAKAAALALTKGERVSEVSVPTPIGIRLAIPINYVKLEGEWAICSVTKYGGDDPDDTNGMEIIVKARLSQEKGFINLRAGKGIGIATQDGLPIPRGEPAINPVPRRQLIDSLKEVLGTNFGVEIIIEAPRGEEIAKRTFNPKLGIVGGISILGTSGIVKPMSVVSWYASMVEQLDIVRAKGYTMVVMVPGNIGESAAKVKLRVPQEAIVQTAVFVGGMLKAAKVKGFKEVILMGHIGKMIKHAIGIWNTHYKYGDGRMETLVAYGVKHGVPVEILRKILEAKTTDDAVDLIKASVADYRKIFNDIANTISRKAEDMLEGKLKVYSVLINMSGEIIGESEGSQKYMA